MHRSGHSKSLSQYQYNSFRLKDYDKSAVPGAFADCYLAYEYRLTSANKLTTPVTGTYLANPLANRTVSTGSGGGNLIPSPVGFGIFVNTNASGWGGTTNSHTGA